VVDESRDRGIDYFDVAPLYGEGEAEIRLGTALAGRRRDVFLACKTLQRDAQGARELPYRFGTIICYEDAIPYVGRNFTLDGEGRKRIDWLVNISNDGWFVRFPKAQGRVIPSSELPQHAAICAFRAVENRLAVVRRVYTGISCLIESTGRIRDGYLAASRDFPAEAMDRTAMAGWFVDRLPIDKRVTFYSRHGEWFADG
jgi:apolipoprotein N-acyltransferase